jgi:hypothetical protein
MLCRMGADSTGCARPDKVFLQSASEAVRIISARPERLKVYHHAAGVHLLAGLVTITNQILD